MLNVVSQNELQFHQQLKVDCFSHIRPHAHTNRGRLSMLQIRNVDGSELTRDRTAGLWLMRRCWCVNVYVYVYVCVCN